MTRLRGLLNLCIWYPALIIYCARLRRCLRREDGMAENFTSAGRR
jgi:hypothetical protein